mgnify:FL=1
MNDNAPRHVATLINENGVRVVEFVLSAQTDGAWHHHSELVEYCYCLKGRLAVEIEGGENVILGPGDKCEIAAGTRHRVCNADHSDCRFLMIQGVGIYDFIQQN